MLYSEYYQSSARQREERNLKAAFSWLRLQQKDNYGPRGTINKTLTTGLLHTLPAGTQKSQVIQTIHHQRKSQGPNLEGATGQILTNPLLAIPLLVSMIIACDYVFHLH